MSFLLNETGRSQMKKIFWLCLVFWTFTITGCSYFKKKALNVYLGRFQDKKAERVYFKSLPSLYKKQEHSYLDALWWNDRTGTSISYFSSCSKVPKDLESFQTSTYPLKRKRVQFSKTDNGIYSVLEVLSSPKDKVYMAIYTTQKEKCYFNINLVANSLSSFEQEEPVFKKFIESFGYR